MRRVIAGLVVLVVAAVVSGCGPDKPETDWSKYSAPGSSAVEGGEQAVY